MSDLNQVTITGTVTQAPELKHFGERELCNMRVLVVEDAFDGKERSTYFSVVGWGQTAGFMQTVRKGERVVVSGRLATRTYDDKAGQKVRVWEIVANRVLTITPDDHISRDEPTLEDLAF